MLVLAGWAGLCRAQTEVTAPRAADRDLLLEVELNGRMLGLVGSFQERAGALRATAAELQALGLVVPSTAAAGSPDGQVALAALPGVRWRIDERRQVLRLDAAGPALRPTRVGGADLDPDPARPTQAAAPGAVVNYQAVALGGRYGNLFNAAIDARGFSPWGVAATTFLIGNAAAPGGGTVLRLDSSFTHTDAAALHRVRVGDVITGGLAWTRPVRIGGVQVSTDFSLRPDLVTYPAPSFVGQVAVPSSVDVLVNGIRQFSQDVPPGPFEVRQLPVVTGAGTVALVVRDALGQQTTQTLPFYASRNLLLPGLSAYSATLGAIRLNYGVLGDDYRAPAAAATLRHGVNQWLTVEAHAEAVEAAGGPGGAVGGGLSAGLGEFGVVSAAVAAGGRRRRQGLLVTAGFERTGAPFSLAASVQASQAGFGDMAAAYGDPAPKLLARGSLGLSLGQVGSLGLAFTALQRDPVRATAADSRLVLGSSGYGYGGLFSSGVRTVTAATRVALVSGSFTRALSERSAFYATAYTDLARGGSAGFVAGISLQLGTRGSAGIDAGVGGGTTLGSARVSRGTPDVGDAGYLLSQSLGPYGQRQAMGSYRAGWGLVSAGVGGSARDTEMRANAQGAVALIDGRLYAANTIDDGFALVDTAGIAGVRVSQENRLVGVTDAGGRLLVPGLRSYEPNRLAIDPADIGLDATIGAVAQVVQPADRGGVVVRFPIRPSQGAVLAVMGRERRWLPVGSVLRLLPDGEALPIGFDGEVHATGLRADNEAEVTLPGGERCRLRFGYAARAGDLPRIGPLVCAVLAADAVRPLGGGG